MRTIQLTVEHGRLHLGEAMLIRRYDAGDCDTCQWPADYSEPELRERLACALYDEREMSSSEQFAYGDAIELPDGKPFDFDQYVP